jgi:hypothetical protein
MAVTYRFLVGESCVAAIPMSTLSANSSAGVSETSTAARSRAEVELCGVMGDETTGRGLLGGSHCRRRSLAVVLVWDLSHKKGCMVQAYRCSAMRAACFAHASGFLKAFLVI